MKRFLKTFSASIVAILTLVPFVSGIAFAASASLYFAPNASSVVNGSTVTVYIHENSGPDAINAVQANFTYPANLLQYVGMTPGSAFGIEPPTNGGGGGSVSGAFATTSSTLMGDQLVASVQFKAIASSGTATFTFKTGANESAVVTYTGNTNILTSSPSASITLTAPAPAPSPSPSPKPSPKPSPSPTPTPTKDTTPPAITGVSVHDITASSATITWTTSEAATSEVDYGLSKTYDLSSVDSKLVTSHSVTLDSKLIVSGTTYHFVVKSTDAAGNAAIGTDNTFATKGVSLQVTVLDEGTGKPVAGATVSYNGQSVTTDSQGQATLTNLPSTKIALTVTVSGKATSETVLVANDTSKLQNASFKVAVPASQTPWALIAIPAVIIVVGAALFAIVRSRMNNSFGSNGGAGGSPVVVTSDNYGTTPPGATVVSPTNPPDNTNHLMQ